jgi:hypothetical protein
MAPATILLDPATWDLVLDANGNIAVAEPPYALAQDAASAILTYLGECYYDTTIGVPWLQQIFGKKPNLSLVRQQLVDAAKTVPDVQSATVYFSSFTGRLVQGQVQVTSASTGQTSVAAFSTTDPQGA